MNLEEIKMELTNQFRDVNNPIVELLLDYCEELEGVECEPDNLKDVSIAEYLPLYLPEHNLLMDISHFVNLNGEYNYRNVLFKERKGECAEYKKIDICTDTTFTTNSVIRVDVIGTSIEFLSIQYLMHFDEDYQLSIDGYVDNAIAGFDVGDGSWYWDAPEFKNNGFSVLSGSVDPLFNLEEWKQTIETVSNTHDYFKDIAEKVNLKEIFAESLVGGARLLSFYSDHKNLKYFLMDETWGKKLRCFFHESVEEPIILSVMESEFNFSEKSIHSILNVPQYFIELNKELVEEDNWFWFHNLIDEFKKLKKVIGFDTKDEYAIVIELLGTKPDSEYLPALSYLIKTGYSLHEIWDILVCANKMDPTSSMQHSLNRLFYVVNGQEILTGRRGKYIPKNLAEEFRLMKQTLGSEETLQSARVRDNFIQKRESLVTKQPILEIVGKNYLHPDALRAEQLQSATDSLYLRKVKNKQYFELKLIGNVLFCPNTSMGTLYFNHLFNWAEENNIYVSYKKHKKVMSIILNEQV